MSRGWHVGKLMLVVAVVLGHPGCKSSIKGPKQAEGSAVAGHQTVNGRSFVEMNPASGLEGLPLPVASREACAAILADLARMNQGGGSTARARVFVGKLPQSWASPRELIQVVMYLIERAPGRSPAPVVFFRGGPGSPIDSVILNALTQPKVYATTDFLVVEQRGNGCSSPIPAANRLETYEDFTSDAIVHDAEAFRRFLLKDRRWVAFGQSFGTVVTYRYLELFPDSLIAIVTHGYSPGLSGFDEHGHRVLGNLKAWRSFLARFPAARTGFDGVTARLARVPEEQPRNDAGEKVHPATLMGEYQDGLLNYRSNWTTLARKLGVAEPVDSDGGVPVTALHPELDPTGFNPRFMEGLALTDVPVLAGDYYVAYRDLGGPAPDLYDDEARGCAAFLRHLSAPKWGDTVKELADAPWLVCGGYARQKARGRPLPGPPSYAKVHTQAKRVPNSLPAVAAGLERIPGSAYLYLSELDPISPPEQADSFREFFRRHLGGKVQLRVVGNSGHEGWRTEPEIMNRVAQLAAGAQ